MKKILILMFCIILLTTGCGTKKEKIVIYTALEENLVQDLKEKSKKEFPEYDVIQYISTGNNAAKIKNEGSNIEADIIVDLETAHIKNLEENFADLSEFDTSKYLDGVNNSTKHLILGKYSMNLIIDNKYFKEHNLEIPKTYEDVMGEDKAIEYFQKLKNNLREFTTSGSGPSNLLKQGEIAIAMGMTSQGVEAINEGYDFSIVQLETGSIFNTTSYGIIKNHENKKGVKEVFEWIINEFQPYLVENAFPDKILKNQENKVKNWPEGLKDADMTGIDSIKTKEHLIELWGKVNG